MLDLLSVDRNGRLVVIELKADEDLHLPLQGLDYWLRVRWLNLQGRDRDGTGDFERNGYFQADPPRPMLSTAPPLLCFIAPALRIHPANEIVLQYLAPEIEWTLIALGEQWREQRTVVFRKHSAAAVMLEAWPADNFHAGPCRKGWSGLDHYKWKREYSVGVAILDQQHQHLFELVNELHEFMTAGQSEAILTTTLTELVACTRRHFLAGRGADRTDLNFPGLDAHRTEQRKNQPRRSQIPRGLRSWTKNASPCSFLTS